MKTPYISIIIPTRNRLRDLRNCLKALTQQVTTDSYEVIIVDDHSHPEVLSKYKDLLRENAGMELRFLQLPPNQRGAVYARNLGIKQAGGCLIGLLDDDCIPSANWVTTLCAYFVNNPTITAITGRIAAVELEHPLSAFRQNFYNMRYERLLKGTTTESIRKRFALRPVEGLYLADYLAGGNSGIRQSALDDVEGFDTHFSSMHDKELAIRLLRRGHVCVFAPDLVARHNHTKSVRDAMQKSFASGRSLYRLQTKHSGVLSDRVVNIFRPFQTIVRSLSFIGGLGWKSVLLVGSIMALEYCHQAGYVTELCRARFGYRS